MPSSPSRVAARVFGDTLMFLLELAVYTSAGYWAFGAGDGVSLPVGIVCCVAALAVLVAVWALLGAPRARYPLRGAGRVVLEVGCFGAGALALGAATSMGAGIALAAAFVVDVALRRYGHGGHRTEGGRRRPARRVGGPRDARVDHRG